MQHLKALRRMRGDGGWIRTLMDEAENERMHLMTFIEIAKPNLLERWLVLLRLRDAICLRDWITEMPNSLRLMKWLCRHGTKADLKRWL